MIGGRRTEAPLHHPGQHLAPTRRGAAGRATATRCSRAVRGRRASPADRSPPHSGWLGVGCQTRTVMSIPSPCHPRRAAACSPPCSLVACSDDGEHGADTDRPRRARRHGATDHASPTRCPLAPATFTVQPGTEQVAVLGAEPGTRARRCARRRRPRSPTAPSTSRVRCCSATSRRASYTIAVRRPSASRAVHRGRPDDVPDRRRCTTDQQTLLPAEAASATSPPATAPR